MCTFRTSLVGSRRKLSSQMWEMSAPWRFISLTSTTWLPSKVGPTASVLVNLFNCFNLARKTCERLQCSHLCLLSVGSGAVCFCPESSSFTTGENRRCDARKPFWIFSDCQNDLIFCLFLAIVSPVPSPELCKCLNGGTCHFNVDGSQICECPQGVSGALCQSVGPRQSPIPYTYTSTGSELNSPVNRIASYVH